MDLFTVFAILITLTAVFSFLNVIYIKLPSTVGVMLASLIATYANPLKFNRFARAVIGPAYPDGKSELRTQLGRNIAAFVKQGQNNPLRHLYPG